MRRGSWVGALLLVVVVVLAAIVWTSRTESSTVPPPQPPVSATQPVEAQLDLEPVPALVSHDDTPPGGADVAPTEPEPAPTAVDPARTLVSCRVLDASDRTPLAEAVVSLRSPRLANPILFECDENGEFDVELTELEGAFGDQVAVVVRDAEGHTRLRGSLKLEPEVLLLVPASVVLNGEIVLPDMLSPQGLNLSIWTSQPNEGERFIGNQALEEDGRFSVHASPVRVPGSFLVRVDRGGIPASVRVPTEELTRAGGARVELALARLAITVLDDVDAPIVRAGVRVFLDPTQPSVTTRYGDATTGAEGVAHVWVPAGPIGVMAGAPRHTAENEHVLLAPGEGQLTVRLRRLSAADVLLGRVELDDGSPAPGAHVVAFYARDDGPLSSASMVQQPADVEGAFELAIATDRELMVTATHKVLGGSDRVRWPPGSGPVRLVIQRGGTVVVQAAALRAREGGSGEIDLALLGPKGQVKIASTDALPLTFSSLEPGPWRVYSVDEGSGSWAVGQVQVVTGRSVEVTLNFGPLAYVAGRVRGRSLQDDTSVEFAPPGWPEVVVEFLLRRDVSEDGAFRVPGPMDAGELRVRVGGRIVERRPARAGTPLDLTLPE